MFKIRHNKKLLSNTEDLVALQETVYQRSRFLYGSVYFQLFIENFIDLINFSTGPKTDNYTLYADVD